MGVVFAILLNSWLSLFLLSLALATGFTFSLRDYLNGQ